MNVPDAAIEAATLAIWNLYELSSPTTAARFATTALSAALPAIRESLAQDMETESEKYGRGTHGWTDFKNAARIIRGGTP